MKQPNQTSGLTLIHPPSASALDLHERDLAARHQAFFTAPALADRPDRVKLLHIYGVGPSTPSDLLIDIHVQSVSISNIRSSGGRQVWPALLHCYRQVHYLQTVCSHSRSTPHIACLSSSTIRSVISTFSHYQRKTLKGMVSCAACLVYRHG